MRTYYDMLGITKDAPNEVVRAAYRALANKYHPDKNPDNPRAEGILKQLNLIIEVLGDPEKRKQYDKDISPRPTVSPNPVPKSTPKQSQATPNAKPKAPPTSQPKTVNKVANKLGNALKYLMVIGAISGTKYCISESNKPQDTYATPVATYVAPIYTAHINNRIEVINPQGVEGTIPEEDKVAARAAGYTIVGEGALPSKQNNVEQPYTHPVQIAKPETLGGYPVHTPQPAPAAKERIQVHAPGRDTVRIDADEFDTLIPFGYTRVVPKVSYDDLDPTVRAAIKK